MQFKQNTIQILDAHGQVITTMVLPANIKLAQLAPLKILGDISVKVLPGAAPFRGICVGVRNEPASRPYRRRSP